MVRPKTQTGILLETEYINMRKSGYSHEVSLCQVRYKNKELPKDKRMSRTGIHVLVKRMIKLMGEKPINHLF